MSKSPLSAAYRKRLRRLIGEILLEVQHGHVAEAIAAGYGYQTHSAFSEAVKQAEASGISSANAAFDVNAAFARLAKFGHQVSGIRP